MALFALSQRTTQTVAGNASWEVRSTAGNKPKLLQMELTQVTAVAGGYGIGRPAAIGITPTSPQTFVDEADGNGAAANTTAAVAWGTAPTIPTNFNRRYTAAGAIGAGFIAVFPGGLGIPVSSSIIIWVLSTSPVCDVSAVVSE